MKKIGYVDYFLDEFHAHRAFKSINMLNEKNGSDFKVTHVWAEKDKEGGLTTAEFCEKHGVEQCATISELADKVDYVIIFAPDNAECKLGYAREVFKAKKRTFIDKTFAEDYDSAKKIFELAKENGVEIFSSSALRYATELKEYNGTADSVLVLGSGVSVEDYSVHYLEIILKTMGVGAKSVCWQGRGDQDWAEITYSDNRKATMAMSTGGDYLNFFVYPTDKGRSAYINVASDIFGNQMEDVLCFFESGKCSTSEEQTLELMKIRDAIIKSKSLGGVKVDL